MCQILMRNIICIVCCFHQVKGKMVRVSACQDNNTLYLGNICKGWTRDQVRYDTLWLRSWKYRCSFYNLQNLIGQLDSLIPYIVYRLNCIFEIRTFSTKYVVGLPQRNLDLSRRIFFGVLICKNTTVQI